MVMDLASFRPPASTRRIDGCAALRARREASVAPAGPASCHLALPDTIYSIAMLELTAHDDNIVFSRRKKMHSDSDLSHGGGS